MSRKIMLLAIPLVLLISAAPALSGQVLATSEDQFDFGYAPQESKVSHVFWLYASDVEPVWIKEVKPGCGCTQAPLETDFLEPGDSTRLEITFKTGRYVNRTVKRPTILIEGHDNVAIDIITYVVTRPDSTYPLMLDPYKIDLSQYGTTVRDRASFKITNVSDRDLNVKVVAGPDEYGTVTMPETIRAGETVEVPFQLKEGSIRRSFESSFTFELSDDSHSRYTIPVRRRFHDPNAVTLTAPGN